MERDEPNQENESLETDPRFPSGPWTGFFLQSWIPGRNWMDLHLTFQNGKVEGTGQDWVGKFLIHGRYHCDDGKCYLTKSYLGKHEVAYEGYNEGKGIWGGWSIPPIAKGGFHIWPVALGDPSQQRLREAADIPVEERAPVGV